MGSDPNFASESQGRFWQAAVVVPADRVGAVEVVFGAGALAFSDFEVPKSPHRRLEALFDHRPDRTALAAALGGLPVTVTPVDDRDWVTESQRLNQPIRAGRFYLRASHHPPHPAGCFLDIRIDAGRAFGTGRHETTRGCLLALDRLARRRRYRRPLDLGCGSGLLALAMARLWRRPVTAADIDPVAVETTRDNARANGLAPLVRAVRADGLDHPALAAAGQFDLIAANILARPLVRLARPLARALAPGGELVLSGLLDSQETMVRQAYRAQGLVLKRRLVLAGWLTLTLGR